MWAVTQQRPSGGRAVDGGVRRERVLDLGPELEAVHVAA